MEAPYFPFYPADWISDPNVQFLSLEESGAYITLLAYMWRDGKECSLPDDDKYLSRLLHVSKQKWRKLREVLIDGEHAVLKKTSDSQIRNKRLDKEWSHMVEKSVKRSVASNTRWEKEKSKNANAMQMHDENAALASRLHMQNDAISDSDLDPDPDPELKKDDDDHANDSNLKLVEGESSNRTSPTVNPYAEIESHMQMRMGNPKYMCQTKDYQFVKKALELGISLGFIIDAIDIAFDEYQPKYEGDGIKSFAYCSSVMNRLWSAQLEKGEFNAEAQVSASRTRDGTRPPSKTQDERYSKFYELFPEP